MDPQALKTLIAQSRILNPADRAYWLSVLDGMNPAQVQKLENILTQAQAIPLAQDVKDYYSAVAKQTTDSASAS